VNVRAVKDDVWPSHADLRVGIDADERIQRQDVAGVGQLVLNGGGTGLQAADLVLQVRVGRLQGSDLVLEGGIARLQIGNGGL
jgi:hypothetical protein